MMPGALDQVPAGQACLGPESQRWPAVLAPVIAGAIALATASCATAPGVQPPHGVDGCEASIDFWWADPPKARFEYVRLDRGELGWGGGIDAFDRRTSWGVPLGAEDCARVAAELAAIDLMPSTLIERTRSEVERSGPAAQALVDWYLAEVASTPMPKAKRGRH